LLWAAALSIAIGAAASSVPVAHDVGIGRNLLAANNGFPWCQCLSYDCVCSPYKITLADYVVNATSARTCFNVAYVGCDKTLACCSGMLKAVEKLTFETTQQCSIKSNIPRVTVNGQLYTSWNTYSHNTTFGAGYELKLYNLGMRNATFVGTQICITTKKPCSTFGDLCYSSVTKGC
ncbi:hypothetical protein Agub_g11720, partial [Astrephomene gubernaculifera]